MRSASIDFHSLSHCMKQLITAPFFSLCLLLHSSCCSSNMPPIIMFGSYKCCMLLIFLCSDIKRTWSLPLKLPQCSLNCCHRWISCWSHCLDMLCLLLLWRWTPCWSEFFCCSTCPSWRYLLLSMKFPQLPDKCVQPLSKDCYEHVVRGTMRLLIGEHTQLPHVALKPLDWAPIWVIAHNVYNIFCWKGWIWLKVDQLKHNLWFMRIG